LILEVLPGYQKVFFSDNGSTSTEVALKLGIQYWKNKGDKIRKKIIAIEGAYHGDTFGAMSLGGKNTFTFPFSEFLFEVEFIPFPEGNGQNSIDKMNEISRKGDAAVFIFEPLVQGASGMRMYKSVILDQLIKIAQENEIVTIADEVMTGFGRTGKLFACDYVDHKPDIVCLSKGISGGFLPLGLTVINEKIVAAFDNEDPEKTFYHGHSFTANPIACAASVTSLKILLRKSVRKRIEQIERKQMEFVSRFEEYEISKNLVKDVRSTGTVLAIELFSENPGYTSSIKEKSTDILWRGTYYFDLLEMLSIYYLHILSRTKKLIIFTVTLSNF
jgi:adenosylmethionine-8-amino-7-oxononanoate aminotransferase